MKQPSKLNSYRSHIVGSQSGEIILRVTLSKLTIGPVALCVFSVNTPRMATLTLRPDDQTAEALRDEYEEYGFENLSDYLRHLLEHRDEIMDGAPSEASLADRVDELEAELADVKAAIRVFHPTGSPERKHYAIDLDETEVGEGVGAVRVHPPESHDPGPWGKEDEPTEGTYSADVSGAEYRSPVDGPTIDESVERVASVDELDLPGSGDTLDARRDALQAMYERLQALGEASKSELLEAVDVDATGYSEPDYFWSNVVAGEDTLSRLPGVVSPGSGHGATWRYMGDDS